MSVAMVEQTEARMGRRVIDAVAAIVGRDVADELANDMPPSSLQLTPHECSLLASAEAEGKAQEEVER